MDPYNHLRSYGESLIESVEEARAEVVAARALAAPSVGLSLRRRILAIATATATFISGNVGMAMAADPAVPGDLLYGFDRAYEQLSGLVGLNENHTEERLDEAAELATAGLAADALDAVIEQIQALQIEPDSSDLDTAVAAVTEARNRSHDPDTEKAEASTKKAKEIVGIAHAIADAVHSGDRETVRDLIKALREAARENGETKARGENNGNSEDRAKADKGKAKGKAKNKAKDKAG